MNRYLLITIISLTIIAALFWFFWQKSREKEPETAPRIVQTPQSYEVEPHKLPEQLSFRFFDTIAPLVEPFEELIPSVTSPSPLLVKEGKSEVFHSLEGDLGDNNQSETSINAPLSASDPIFKKLYPDYYLNALSVIHRVMVNDGFLPNASFDVPDEDTLFAFLWATINYAETKKFIAQTDAERFRKALYGETRELLRKERYSFLNQMLDYFKTSRVFASIVTSPDCYADPLPFNIVPGVNLPFDYCCNCGLICTKVGPPVFVPDCSIKSCDIPLGCLNLVCPGGNAIWDPLTGICGCDNPISSAENIPSILKNALNCIAPKAPTPPTPPPPPPSTP